MDGYTLIAVIAVATKAVIYVVVVLLEAGMKMVSLVLIEVERKEKRSTVQKKYST